LLFSGIRVPVVRGSQGWGVTVLVERRHFAAVTGTPLLSFVVGAIVGEVTTVTLLWELGAGLAVGGMPFGGAVLGVCAALAATYRT
jgi:hypothetical protein